MKIGCIGLGTMGAALVRAMARIDGVELLLSDHNPQKAAALQAEVGGSILPNSRLVAEADVILLAVKPSLVAPLLSEWTAGVSYNSNALWLSVAAGVTLESLSVFLPAEQVVRLMPNTPVAIGEGMTTYCLTNPAHSSLVAHLLSQSGQVLELPEALMDPATALAGCGPAFVYQMIEAMTDAGIEQGLTAQQATYLAAQTVAGAAQIVLRTDKHPAILRQEVTSPGGATIAGVVSLEKTGFRYALIKALSSALKRTKQLGKKGD